MKRAALFLCLGLAACDRSNQQTSATGRDAGAAPPAAPSAPAATPVASVPAPATSSSSMPRVEAIPASKCPARIATVKLDKQRVELTGCPESEPGKGKSFLALVDEKGTKLSAVDIVDGEAHSETLEVKDLYGTGRPVFFVTMTAPTMGSWQGPTTTLYEIENDRLVPVQVTNKDGKREPFELVSSLRIHWWLHPARSGKGQDIYVIRSSAENKDIGYRYFFESGKWTGRFNQLKKWTGEHLKDTEAEFP